MSLFKRQLLTNDPKKQVIVLNSHGKHKMSEHNLSTSDIAELFEGQKKNLMPDGAYTASIIEAVMVPYRSLDGEYVRVTFEVVQNDEYNGRRLYEIFNIYHPTNPHAVGRAKFKLAQLVESTDLELQKFNNIDALLGKTTRVEVTTEHSEEWGDRNKIVQFVDYYVK